MEPITRKERILSGEDIKPITRLEHFLKEAVRGGGSDLPEYTSADAGKVLGLVDDGEAVVPAWQTPSGVLICNTTYDDSDGTYLLDKTAGEIYNALLAGTPVYIKYQYGSLEEYSGTFYLAPVIKFTNYNYTDELRIYASKPWVATVSNHGDAGIPGVLVYISGGLDDYPVFNNTKTTAVNNASMINIGID